MGEEMEVEVEVGDETVLFEAYETDIGYEFDAAMYFDFSRVESPVEACLAELWFQSAKSYPPSPFVANLFSRGSTLLETNDSSQELPKPAELRRGENIISVGSVILAADANNKGYERAGIFSSLRDDNEQKCIYQGHKSSSVRSNAACKPFVPRSSTLMKPTASQLAKQSQVGSARFQNLPGKNDANTLCNYSGVESHASKKQKLDGGYSRKVMEEQQANFFRKISRKDAPVDKNAPFSKLKLTIPREPDLETANRAQRMRSKNHSTELAQEKVAARRFKARPLNRKILEAPSFPLIKKSTPKLPEFCEFRLKTLERATQNAPSISSKCNDFDKASDKLSTFHVSSKDTPKQDKPAAMHEFKARPLNRKIFLSKGDIGMFRTAKREATTPMELNLHTQKRIIQRPPTDLFSKLSLKSELQPTDGSKNKLPPASTFQKGSKENRFVYLKPEHEVVKEKTPLIENRLNSETRNPAG